MIIGLCGNAGVGKDAVADFLVRNYHFVKVAFADPIKRAAMEWWDFSEEQLWGQSKLRNEEDERYLLRCLVCGGHGGVDGVRPSGPIGFQEPECSWCCGEGRAFLTPRHALQQIGTEVARAIDPDVWARYTLRIAKKLMEDPYSGPLYHRRLGLCSENDICGPSYVYKGVVISDVRFKNELRVIKENGGKVGRIIRPSHKLPEEMLKHASEAEQLTIPDEEFDFILHNTDGLEALFEQATQKIIGGLLLQTDR